MNKFESLDIDNFDDLKLGEIYFKFLKEINTN